MKVKILIEVEQEIEPENYRENDTPMQMIQCDLENDPGMFLTDCVDMRIVSVDVISQ